jgi:hypothetical protein
MSAQKIRKQAFRKEEICGSVSPSGVAYRQRFPGAGVLLRCA